MIAIFHPDRLTRQPFCHALINYLDQHEEVTLRQIRQDFPDIRHLERDLEAYIQAGYICRTNRRYRLTVPLLEELGNISLDQLVFVETTSPVYEDLLALRFETQLNNQTNAVVLIEETDFARQRLTLSNYFHLLREERPISSVQQPLYELLGDVNPEYALKYMTSFLLKFAKKDLVKQKRPDIFVEGLVLLGYLEKASEDSYRLKMDLDKENLIFRAKKQS